ncbi:tetratricopeptide repeat-containing protein [Pseudenhygromyxa sp. WMMC2535]|uniref:tetratricopeptide repeat protein n=1 Tax=Pseudenhygromyxa sp. WMMC2535 TaxID=2712867 RepID=UPI0015571C5F|nr:tetratricopeptide repeat protein [Pseudenhygromyxa sp. WMMC2535]NVB38905.1 tetratricopeptide repeat-containing protein [Pseudenhygromyxa sp. WMMC2535]
MTVKPTTTKWHTIGQLLTGLVLGGALTFGGLALAGKLKPPGEPEALVALAQTVEASDRKVDVMLERGDVSGGIAALESLREIPWPSRERGGDAAVQLRHDAYGRLLRLRLDHPQVDAKTGKQLLELADEGLGREWEQLDPNPFTARLLALRGEVLEGLGRDDDALLLYEQALDMNRDLLDEVIQEVGR